MLLSKTNLLYIILLCILLLLASCQNTPDNNSYNLGKDNENKQLRETVPNQLKDIENSIEEIVKTLDGPSIMVSNEDLISKKTSEGKTISENKQESQSSDKDEKENNSENGSNNSSDMKEDKNNKTSDNEKDNEDNDIDPNSVDEPWSNIRKTIQDLHIKWNEYIPEAKKTQVSNQLLDDFSFTLNVLTTSSSSKNTIDTLSSANNLYFYVTEFMPFYETQIPLEIKKSRYYIRSLAINSMMNRWDEADKNMQELSSLFPYLKNAVKLENNEFIDKLDYLIVELKNALEDKSFEIIDIKSKICMSVLNSIEEALEEDQQNEDINGNKM